MPSREPSTAATTRNGAWRPTLRLIDDSFSQNPAGHLPTGQEGSS
jgi:hypothetical protein